MKVESDKVVSIDYTLRNDDGDILDQSSPDAPLAYLHGHGNLIEGLENALLDKDEGDQLTADYCASRGLWRIRCDTC